MLDFVYFQEKSVPVRCLERPGLDENGAPIKLRNPYLNQPGRTCRRVGKRHPLVRLVTNSQFASIDFLPGVYTAIPARPEGTP